MDEALINGEGKAGVTVMIHADTVNTRVAKTNKLRSLYRTCFTTH
jgi:hypothetical protein